MRLKSAGKTMEFEGVQYAEVLNFAHSPMESNPELIAIVVDYRNNELISDIVCPRVVVPKSEFKYRKFSRADGFTIPDTVAGRKGGLNQLEFGGTLASDYTLDYGLMAQVPQDDLDNAQYGYNPINHHTEKIAELIALDREKRVAAMVFGTGNYGSSNKLTKDGNTGLKYWNDTTNSDPIADILKAKESCTQPVNILTLGPTVWRALRQHPKVVSAVLGNSGVYGTVSKQQLAEKLELEQIVVGTALNQTANKGQTKAYGFIWNRYASLNYVKKLSSTQLGTSQFFTAQFGTPVATSYPVNPGVMGLTGGTAVVAGERVKEVCPADDFGYLFINAVESTF